MLQQNALHVVLIHPEMQCTRCYEANPVSLSRYFFWYCPSLERCLSSVFVLVVSSSAHEADRV